MKLRQLLIRLAALTLSVSIFARPTPVWACSCMMPPAPAQAFGEAQAVFLGTANGTNTNISVPFIDQVTQLWAQWTQTTPSLPNASSMPQVEFAVQDSWKGVTTTTTLIATSESSASCGVEFLAGQQYVVYAYDFDGTGLQTNICTRTTDIANAGADLTYLNTQPKLTLSPSASPFWPIMIAGIGLLIGLAAAGVWIVRRKPAAKKDML